MAEVLAALIGDCEDFDAGILARVVNDADLSDLLTARGVQSVGSDGWRAIDAAERARGVTQRRPRVKFVAIEDMLEIVRT